MTKTNRWKIFSRRSRIISVCVWGGRRRGLIWQTSKMVFHCVWGYFACYSTLIRLNWVEINFFLLIPGQTFIFANFRGAPDVNPYRSHACTSRYLEHILRPYSYKIWSCGKKRLYVLSILKSVHVISLVQPKL